MPGLVERINRGWGEIEPVIVGLMAMNRSFMLIGRHGTGKTRLAKVLSRGYGEEGFVFYDATKDDLISVAGIPDAEAMGRGELRFVAHERTIWGKTTIVVDEVTRAGKESQNLWLEVLEERTCFGLPLAYQSLIATANPESYAAAFQLDEALLDRFYAVVPVPEMQEASEADVRAMVGLGFEAEGLPDPAEIVRTFQAVQRARRELVHEGARDAVAAYVGQVVPAMLAVLREQGKYVSPRTYARNLPECILAVAAWYRQAGARQPLRKGAVDALRYGVATKLQVKPVMLEQLHRAAEALLDTGPLPDGERIRLEIAGLATFEDRIGFVRSRWGDLKAALRPDEVEKVLGELLRGATRKGEKEKLVALKAALDEVGYKGDALRQVDGRLLVAINSGLNRLLPRLARIRTATEPDRKRRATLRKIDRFLRLASGGTFLADGSPEAQRMKAWIIDVEEGDVPSDDATILAFMESFDL